jgi:hypothetical protein
MMRVEDIPKSEFYTTMALGQDNLKMFTVREFIEETKFPIDGFMIDRFWDNMDMDIPIYLDDKLIKWCGYKGDKSEMKKAFVKFMKRNNIEITELETPEYIKYYEEREGTDDPSLKHYKNPTSISKNSTNEIHVLISAFNFKRMVMRLNTEKGEQIRDYFLALELLVKYYCGYQTAFERRLNEFSKKIIKEKDNKIEELSRKIDYIINQNNDLKEDLGINQEILMGMNSKLDKATDERAPKTEAAGKRDAFMIVRTNKPDYQWSHYAIRVQHGSLKRTLKKLRTKYPSYAGLVTIPYQPNGINFFNLMKEKLKKEARKIDTNHNKIKLAVGYTEEQFIRDIKDLDMSKKEVEDESSEE